MNDTETIIKSYIYGFINNLAPSKTQCPLLIVFFFLISAELSYRVKNPYACA